MGQDEDRRPAKATAPFVPTVGGRVSFAPFHHPTLSECQRACQLVDPTTPTTQKHRSSEARTTNLVRRSLEDEDIAPAAAPETAYE